MLITYKCNISLFSCHHEDIVEQSIEDKGRKYSREKKKSLKETEVL